MRGGLLCQAGRSNDLHKASGLDLRQPQGAQVGDLVRPGESEQEPNRASKRANSSASSDLTMSCLLYLVALIRGPLIDVATFPTPHEAYGLCAVRLPQFKAAGLVQVIRPARPHLLSAEP